VGTGDANANTPYARYLHFCRGTGCPDGSVQLGASGGLATANNIAPAGGCGSQYRSLVANHAGRFAATSINAQI
jgi:hypothetical protein